MSATTMLRLPEVLRRRGVSRQDHYRHVAAGTFTRPVKLGPQISAWPEHEVEALTAAKLGDPTEEQIKSLVARLMAQRAERAAAALREVSAA